MSSFSAIVELHALVSGAGAIDREITKLLRLCCKEDPLSSGISRQ